MQPTRKQQLLRIALSVGICGGYVFLAECNIIPMWLYGTTREGIFHFLLAIGLIGLNLRGYGRPIRHYTLAIYLAGFAMLMLAFKLEGYTWGPWAVAHELYSTLRHGFAYLCIGIAALLPMFVARFDAWNDSLVIVKVGRPKHSLKYGMKLHTNAVAVVGRVLFHGATLLFVFAIAFPNIGFVTGNDVKLYLNTDATPTHTDIYAIGRRDCSVFEVLQADSVDSNTYHKVLYRRPQMAAFLISPSAQDTIWLRMTDPPHTTIESTNNSLTRWQWQYRAWQWLKEIF